MNKDIPNCYSKFIFVGKISDMQREQLYREKPMKNKKELFNIVKFGVKINDNDTLYVHLNGFENSIVKLNKYNSETQKYEFYGNVKWQDRFNLESGVYPQNSVNLDGDRMTSFDACRKIRDGFLKDDDVVEIAGYISYFKGENDFVETGFAINSIKKETKCNFGAWFLQEVIFGKIQNNNLTTNIISKKKGYRYIYKINDNVKTVLGEQNLKLFNSFQIYGEIEPYIQLSDNIVEDNLKYNFNITGVKIETKNTKKYTRETFM